MCLSSSLFDLAESGRVAWRSSDVFTELRDAINFNIIAYCRGKLAESALGLSAHAIPTPIVFILIFPRALRTRYIDSLYKYFSDRAAEKNALQMGSVEPSVRLSDEDL